MPSFMEKCRRFLDARKRESERERARERERERDEGGKEERSVWLRER